MKRKTKTVKTAAAPVAVVFSGVQTFRPEVVRLSEIRPGANHRKHFDAESMGELTASVRHFGIQSPLLVRPLPVDQVNGVRFEIVFGERRFRAASDAGLAEVPVMVRDLTDREALEISVLENLQRKDVLATEEADGMAALVAGGDYTAATLAEKLGKSVQHVQGRLRLAKLPQWLRDAVEEGKCDVGVALLIASVPKEHQDDAYSRFCDSGRDWSYRDVADAVEREYRRDLRKSSFPWKTIDCKACLSRGANVDGFEGAGTMCLNVDCFNRQEAANARLVLLAAGGKCIMPADWERERCSGRYLDTEETCPEDPKHRTYAKVLGKSLAEVTSVTMEEGKLVRVLSRQAWAKLALEVIPGLAEHRAKEKAEVASCEAKAKASEERADTRFRRDAMTWAKAISRGWRELTRTLPDPVGPEGEASYWRRGAYMAKVSLGQKHQLREWWFFVPPGSAVVIDEAGEIWSTADRNKRPDELMSVINRHAHFKWDFQMLCHSLNDIDPVLRRKANYVFFVTNSTKEPMFPGLHLMRGLVWPFMFFRIRQYLGLDVVAKQPGREVQELDSWNIWPKKRCFANYKSFTHSASLPWLRPAADDVKTADYQPSGWLRIAAGWKSYKRAVIFFLVLMLGWFGFVAGIRKILSLANTNTAAGWLGNKQTTNTSSVTVVRGLGSSVVPTNAAVIVSVVAKAERVLWRSSTGFRTQKGTYGIGSQIGSNHVARVLLDGVQWTDGRTSRFDELVF